MGVMAGSVSPWFMSLCWSCGQSGLLLYAAFLGGDTPQYVLTSSTSPLLLSIRVTAPHIGFCLSSYMDRSVPHYFESFITSFLACGIPGYVS